ncbi:MAG: hypothetical protein RIT81_33735 [Deltaproteobacteria bacterium]
MKLETKTQGVQISPEAKEALGEMRSQMRSVCRLMREMDRSSQSYRDSIEPQRAQVESGPASSVRGRDRHEDGVAPHELRARRKGRRKRDTIDGAALLASAEVDSLLDKVFGAPSTSGMPLIVPRGGGGTYLDRNLLRFYLGHMAQTSQFLDRISFYQSEEFKVDRRWGDMYRRNDAVNEEYDADRRWAADEALYRASADMAAEQARLDADLRRDDYYRDNP